jgi:hypothetical protein
MSRARDLASSGVTSTVLSAKAPLASPDFTGTVDLTGTTVNLDNDQISGDKVSGGTIGAGTFNGTIGGSATFPLEQHQYTQSGSTAGFENSWLAYDWTSTTSTENGIRIRRMGPLYIVDLSVYKSSVSTGTFSEEVLDLGSDITHPTNNVWLGLNTWHNASHTERLINPYITPSGKLYIRGTNDTGTGVYLVLSLIGLDVA